ncbi:radical SAM protein [Cohnella fermenti]|uniref:Radical SAM protein n=1 Tax=Cohnella fermenti TaxID=2565925 RepID=A0A4S4C6A6_9BACL|nr:radical SAM protein [Cohnella fermenti]THF83325.1 radical SAM protein [Cohnella fermenti]
MLAFYPRFVRTFDDLPGHVSLLIHSWSGCNMRCLGCHNYDELIAAKPDGRQLSAAQVIERLSDGCGLFDALLLSGGEFLMNGLAEIEDFLRRARERFDGPVVVLTNGSYPRKLRRLLDNGLLDGALIDMKLPFHQLDPQEDRDIYEAIIGIVPSERRRRDLLESVEAVIRHNSKLSQVRTVRYPLLSDEYFEQIRVFVDTMNRRHGSSVPCFLNPFFPPEVPVSPESSVPSEPSRSLEPLLHS